MDFGFLWNRAAGLMKKGMQQVRDI
jgi:hypothetical protein